MINSPQKKSLVFFSSAPQGTLGDPSAVSKLVNALKEKYSNDLEITIVIRVENAFKDRVAKIFPKDVNLLFCDQYSAYSDYEDTTGKVQKLPDILKKSDAVIFFPTFHHMNKYFVKDVSEYNKPFFISTEYDLHETNKETQLKNARDWMSVFETGLGEGNLGIFCTDELTRPSLALSKIEDEGDVSFRNFLLDEIGNPSKEQLAIKENSYFSEHELFFGYFNKLNSEHVLSTTNPLMFIESCLELAPPEKSIDIVLPLTDKSQDKDDNKHFKTMKALANHIAQNPNLHKNYRFEFYKKNQNGEMELGSQVGNGDKVVRIINGFPFSPSTVDKLMKASNPFVFVTGDQSLSEAISNEKIFLYQAMWWKEPFFKNLIAEVVNNFPQSTLYAFLSMQIDGKSSVEEIKNYLHKHKTELLEDIVLFKKHLLVNANLYDNLPNRLMESLYNPALYIQECTKNKTYQSKKELLQLFKLLLIFPEELNTICKNTNVEPAILIKLLAKNMDDVEPETFKLIIAGCEKNNLVEKYFNEFAIILNDGDKKINTILQSTPGMNKEIVLPNNDKLKLSVVLDRVDKMNEIITSHFESTDKDAIFNKSQIILDQDQEQARQGKYYYHSIENPLFLIQYDPVNNQFLMIPQSEQVFSIPEENVRASFACFSKYYNLENYATSVSKYFESLNLDGVTLGDLQLSNFNGHPCYVLNSEQLSQLFTNFKSVEKTQKKDYLVSSEKFGRSPKNIATEAKINEPISSEQALSKVRMKKD